MENSRYNFSPIITRENFKLPNQAHVAVWIGINIEHFDVGISEFGGTSSFKVKPPNVFDYALRDYGNRIGFWRILNLLDKHKIRASVLLNSDVCKYYPIIVEYCKKMNWEFVGHGTTNSILLNELEETEEIKIIQSTINTIYEAVGERPKGWLSPALQETFNTPDFLSEEGIKYLCDWCCDDQPFPMKVKTGSLISLPYSVELNDFKAFLIQKLAPNQYYSMIKSHFDILFQEGKDQARVMCIGLHPFIIGQPFRITWLDKIIQYIKNHNNVWFATGWEIAEWYHKNYM